ncbi:hypothetical protein TRIUR3_17457 [Triticum urartu]|uniref:Uncharacterized protein n=1 Tax=Triticum urartu TaxID=4572 RepID=M7ZB02_TRIUA|nr:hypothetical protein TRIUR3_17457 [Triticum urartu]
MVLAQGCLAPPGAGTWAIIPGRGPFRRKDPEYLECKTRKPGPRSSFELTDLFWFVFFEKLAARSNQCGTEHSGQPVEDYEQSKKGSYWAEEQLPIENGKHHLLNNEHHIVDKNNGNPQNREKLNLECDNSIQGAVTTLKAHLTGSKEEGTVPCKNDQQPSNNGMHMQTSEKCAIDEKLAARSNQCGKHHCGQPVENYEQSKICSDWPEEQLPMEHEKHHVLNNEHQIVDKNTENSQNKQVLRLVYVTMFGAQLRGLSVHGAGDERGRS